jgi:hypothetical protein
MKRALVAFLVGGAALAEEPAPAAPPAPALSPDEEKQLAQALSADAASNAAKQQQNAVPQQTAPSFIAPLTRAFQSLNPDLSVIVDFGAGYYSGPTVKNGDDPGDTGANLQELEVAFQATVDPYFRADVYLTIPNLQGIEVEEAFLTTSSLPWSLQLRAGVFRAAFGRQNTQHLHLQDFTRRPAMNALLLGPDGLRAPGLEVSWLAPLPFYLLLTGEALSVPANDDPTTTVLHTFGGGQRTDLTYLANARAFFPLSDSLSALLGLSFATGKTSLSPGTFLDDHWARLYGADLYVKWKPPNVSNTYMSLAWTTEYWLREIPGLGERLEGGLYSQLVWQAARRLFVGLRGEVDGLPSIVPPPPLGVISPTLAVTREYAASSSFTIALSEFARVRLHGELRFPDGQPTVGVVFLQLEASIGAHGAHPY